MSRLRNPVRAIREPFGTAGLIVAIVALVAALGGGAYAASGGSSGGKATASAKKGKAGPRGKTGKTGKTGPIGKTGPAGPAGAPGAKGGAGAAGKDGAAGAAGKSLVTGPAGAECPEGGFTVEVQGEPKTKKFACNGEEGSPGAEGALGTAGTTLPPGAKETGGWAFDNSEGAGAVVHVAISLPIPRAEGAGGAGEVHFQGEATFEQSCPGNVYNPAAEEGQLCIYSGTLAGAAFDRATDFGEGELGMGRTGAVLFFNMTEAVGHGFGSWAYREAE